jgi:Sec-independent protein translocase protein TatA
MIKISRISLLGVFLLLCMAFCTGPEQENTTINNAEVLEEKVNLIVEEEPSQITAIDSVDQVKIYLKNSKERLKENAKNLKECILEFKSDSAEIKSAFEQKLTSLNKKNLELLSVLNKATTSVEKWETVKTEFNKELDELEQSIENLKQDTRR